VAVWLLTGGGAEAVGVAVRLVAVGDVEVTVGAAAQEGVVVVGLDPLMMGTGLKVGKLCPKSERAIMRTLNRDREESCVCLCA